jgi:hypothetical protein
MKGLRKLICEEIAKSIPFEYDIQLYKNTNWKSNLFLGHKAYKGTDYEFPDRRPEIKQVNNVPSEEYYKRIKESNKTPAEKEFSKDLSSLLKQDVHSKVKGAQRNEIEEWIPSQVVSAPRLDTIMCGAVLLEFNVNKIFRDLNDNFVFHISTEPKLDDRSQNYLPGGKETRSLLDRLANDNQLSVDELKLQLKKGMQLEMRHTKDELVALEVAISRLMNDPTYYRNMALQGENSTGVSIYARPNAKKGEVKMMELLERLNKVFGTMYYIDTSYPKQDEDIFVIKSGKIDANTGKPLSVGQFLDFDKIKAEQEAILRTFEAANGLKSITADNTPWREITEPLDVKPVRSAIEGSSARNV